jgi:hypothetical protein
MQIWNGKLFLGSDIFFGSQTGLPPTKSGQRSNLLGDYRVLCLVIGDSMDITSSRL